MLHPEAPVVATEVQRREVRRPSRLHRKLRVELAIHLHLLEHPGGFGLAEQRETRLRYHPLQQPEGAVPPHPLPPMAGRRAHAWLPPQPRPSRFMAST